MDEQYKAFLGIQYDIFSVPWDCQSRTKYYAADKFYTCPGSLHILLSSIIDGLEYGKAGPGCRVAYCQICGEGALGLVVLYSRTG